MCDPSTTSQMVAMFTNYIVRNETSTKLNPKTANEISFIISAQPVYMR